MALEAKEADVNGFVQHYHSRQSQLPNPVLKPYVELLPYF